MVVRKKVGNRYGKNVINQVLQRIGSTTNHQLTGFGGTTPSLANLTNWTHQKQGNLRIAEIYRLDILILDKYRLEL